MAKLQWHQEGAAHYETGVKEVVLFVHDGTKYKEGVAWDGVTGITESPSGADITSLYAEDIKYVDLQAAEEFGFTIEAYMYPEQFEECDGSKSFTDAVGMTISAQARSKFGIAYVTTVGNDSAGNKFGEKLHLLYKATAQPSEKAYSTINDSPEAITFSWEGKCTATTFTVDGVEYSTFEVIVDTTKLETGVNNANYKALKAYIQGSNESGAANNGKPILLLPDQVYEVLKNGTVTLS